jgi:hypothetical protein
MIRRLFGWLGVDYEQWKALTRASLKIDFRVGSMRTGFEGSQNASRSHNPLVWLVIFHVFTAFFFTAFILVNKNIFLTSTIFGCYLMFMIGSMILIEHNAVVVSPEDHGILGYRPIGSRTFFAARLANVLCYVAIVTTAMALLPSVGYFFTLGFRPSLGLAALVAFYALSFTTALAMILLYTAILSFVHPNRLRRVLSYVQLASSMLVYGAFFLAPRLVAEQRLQAFSLEERAWAVFVPPTWFTSYLRLAVGDFRVAAWGSALLSLVLMGVLVVWAAGNLSLRYSRDLAALAATSEDASPAAPTADAATKTARLFFRSGEARAIALLIRSQFRYDLKFRMAVLSIFPLTILYLLYGMSTGRLADPFESAREAFSNSMLVYLAVLLFPVMLKTSLASSDHYQASWIFFSAPAERDRLVLSAKNFVVVYFLIPYLCAVCLLFAYFYTAVWHALVQVAILGSMGHLALQIAVLLAPDVPFSRPVRKGEAFSRVILFMVLPFIFIGLLSGFALVIYPDMGLTLALVAFMLLLTFGFEQVLKARIRGRLARVSFQG